MTTRSMTTRSLTPRSMTTRSMRTRSLTPRSMTSRSMTSRSTERHSPAMDDLINLSLLAQTSAIYPAFLSSSMTTRSMTTRSMTTESTERYSPATDGWDNLSILAQVSVIYSDILSSPVTQHLLDPFAELASHQPISSFADDRPQLPSGFGDHGGSGGLDSFDAFLDGLLSDDTPEDPITSQLDSPQLHSQWANSPSGL